MYMITTLVIKTKVVVKQKYCQLPYYCFGLRVKEAHYGSEKLLQSLKMLTK